MQNGNLCTSILLEPMELHEQRLKLDNINKDLYPIECWLTQCKKPIYGHKSVFTFVKIKKGFKETIHEATDFGGDVKNPQHFYFLTYFSAPQYLLPEHKCKKLKLPMVHNGYQNGRPTLAARGEKKREELLNLLIVKNLDCSALNKTVPCTHSMQALRILAPKEVNEE